MIQYYTVAEFHRDQQTGVDFFFTPHVDNSAKLNIRLGKSKFVPIPHLYFKCDNNVVKTDPTLVSQYCKKINVGQTYEKVAVPVASSRAGKENKPNPFVVPRFVRPLHRNDNLYGVTLVFILNYETRIVDVGISICNGDNFVKQIGIDLALDGSNFVSGLHMPDDIYACNSADSLVQWFFERSPSENQNNENATYNISWKTIKLMLDIYQSSKHFSE